MARIPIFVGLDYHQNSVQVCVLDAAGKVLLNARFRNDWRAIREQINGGAREVFAAIECCVGAAAFAEELVDKAGWSVELAHPGYVSRMKQNPDKTDYSDARLLADLTRVGYLPRVWLAPQSIRELRRLVRYRQQLVNERRNIKLRVSALLRDHRLRCPVARPWTARWLDWVERCAVSEQTRWMIDRHLERMALVKKEIKAVEQRLQQVTAEDVIVNRLLGHRGIGPVTAWTLRAEVGRFDRFRSGKQPARFCGLSPRNASSGERQADAGLVKAANRQLRATLIEATHHVVRFDPKWSRRAAGLRRAGKPYSVVVAAIGNRWMRCLYHEMKKVKVA